MEQEMTQLPLNQLKPGEKGVIVAINACGRLRQRLLSMGFTRGSEIHVVKRAPLGDPIQYRVKGISISLRGSDAGSVTVKACLKHAALGEPVRYRRNSFNRSDAGNISARAS